MFLCRVNYQIPNLLVCHHLRFGVFSLKYVSCFWYCKYTTGDIQPWYVLWTYYKVLSGDFLWKSLTFLSRCQPRNLLTSRFVKMNWSSKYTMLILLLILATSPWVLSELWGSGVLTPDIDHSGPRLCRLLLRRLLIGTAPHSSPAVWYLSSPPSSFVASTTGSSAHLGVPRLRNKFN